MRYDIMALNIKPLKTISRGFVITKPRYIVFRKGDVFGYFWTQKIFNVERYISKKNSNFLIQEIYLFKCYRMKLCNIIDLTLYIYDKFDSQSDCESLLFQIFSTSPTAVQLTFLKSGGKVPMEKW